MFFRSSARLSLLLLTSSAIVLAACSSGVKTGAATTSPTPSGTATSTPDNGTPTPTGTATGTPAATPTATPAAETTVCSFVWVTSWYDVDYTLDLYEVDVVGSAWKNSTVAFDGVNAVGYYLYGYDPDFYTIYEAGMAQDGAIALNVGGMAIGDAAGFGDTVTHSYLDATEYFRGNSNTLGGEIATGGIGSFSGVLSDPAPSAPFTAGAGTIDAAGLSFGGASDYAWDYAVCAPITP